ncbi:hypothetical protein ANN_19154 [Periplaneta americana]|uniref:Uncharacterized protein n=1 Tax=Periplaneta americana TaxID=6978 RepID=A0ABQ8SA02_PERAM|nr:hypothetical protein ANN_19154 [Periplaneta americana]
MLTTPNDVAFTQEEILRILKNFDPTKSPGEDGLSSDIILRSFKQFPKFFSRVYNRCLETGHFPKIWKRSTIIPIVKPG